MADSSTPDRAAEIERFLARAGWGDAAVGVLAADASFRRYLRVRGRDATAVLMDAPPDREDVRPFVAIAQTLTHLGFSAPARHAVDTARGLLLLEDLGDRLIAHLVDEPRADPTPWYRLATDTLAALHDAWAHASANALPAAPPPAYDDAKLIDGEAMLLLDWYAPAIGLDLGDHARAAYAEAWRRALTPARALPQTLVLRDYFPNNLIHLPERPGVRACGLLDFQDAVVGPCAYDLMSLLQDARRDVPEDLEEMMLRRYLDARPSLAPTLFRDGYTVLAAQRHAKVIGIFTRLARRDGKAGYLPHLPRLWRMLDRALAHPALGPVADWVDSYLPAERRGTPDAEARA